MIDVSLLTTDLERNAQTIAQFVAGMESTEAIWKPAEDAWSVLETVCHLRDEEREDFRPRIAHLVGGRSGDMPAIDPEGWVTSRNYQREDLGQVVKEFLAARKDALAWLSTLRDPNWNASFDHASGYTIRAGDIAVSWAAHDVLHLRQLARIRFAYLTHVANPFTTLYAGEW